jgi:hypothetical protein
MPDTTLLVSRVLVLTTQVDAQIAAIADRQPSPLPYITRDAELKLVVGVLEDLGLKADAAGLANAFRDLVRLIWKRVPKDCAEDNQNLIAGLAVKLRMLLAGIKGSLSRWLGDAKLSSRIGKRCRGRQTNPPLPQILKVLAYLDKYRSGTSKELAEHIGLKSPTGFRRRYGPRLLELGVKSSKTRGYYLDDM